MKQKTKKPWPTKAAMEQVYDMKLWGDNHTKFYSGEGSHHPDLVWPYLENIKTFLNHFSSPIVVCDLGCGDFNIGRHLVKHSKKYIAVDIVPSLIAYNINTFNYENLEFKCLDIAKDALPSGDCAILRQVLQHLSNTEIQCILNKLTAFKYVIITEHIPEGDFIPNLDIISGQGIRLKKGSGVNILEAPFNFKVKKVTELLSVTSKQFQGKIVTTCYMI
ncbi:class I SAM-dependent methyltransferase [Formosa sediminum]|uniref:Class I SAM-dependent methyltransferase n=1 Tax=Formosa sediminum TaxID=2594004 RepID=A0A516GUA3_9FLAO|nr:class I SAM-dependent methyltransferase [Formosa sediminum]QDO95093.1 class I SAM-dependent methyltransferase [Formosa sediminum]